MVVGGGGEIEGLYIYIRLVMISRHDLLSSIKYWMVRQLFKDHISLQDSRISPRHYLKQFENARIKILDRDNATYMLQCGYR